MFFKRKKAPVQEVVLPNTSPIPVLNFHLRIVHDVLSGMTDQEIKEACNLEEANGFLTNSEIAYTIHRIADVLKVKDA